MMQKPYFKVIIWILTAAFFFTASSIIISALSPNPTMQQSMQFMTGMMKAMDNSFMGLSMTLEHDPLLITLIGIATQLTIPLVVAALLFGLIVRFGGGKHSS